MMIKTIRLEDTGPFEELEINAGSLTILEGRNGAGKTTILKSLMAVFEGGFDCSLIRGFGTPDAAKKSTVTITLDSGVVIKKVTTHKQSTLTVTTEDGTPVPETPAAFVKGLATGFALDPISFVEAGKRGAAGWKDRQKFLQAVLPITFTAAEIEAAGCPLDKSEASKIYDIDTFDVLLKDRYEKRTAVNSKAEGCDSTITLLTRSLPGETDSKDWAAEAVSIQADLKAGQEAINMELAQVQEQLTKDLDGLRLEYEHVRDEGIAVAQKRKDEVRAAAQPAMDAKKAELAVAQERSKASATVEGTKKNIEQVRAQARGLVKERIALERAVEGMRELKKKKLDSSPIEGLEIRDGKIYVDGLDYDSQLNQARQYDVAMAIAALSPGSFMVCDRAETMDDGTFAEFKRAAVSSGRQLFMARVSDGPLTVETHADETVAAV